MRGPNQLIETAQKGALITQIEYSKWSGGLGVVNSGVESFVSAKIAERIHIDLHSTRKLFVGLEYPVQDIIAGMERKIRGRKGGRLNDNGRVDIVVWDSDTVPRVIIEVKRQFRWSALQNDAERIYRFLDKFGSHHDNGSIDAGIIIVPFVTWRRGANSEVRPTDDTINEVKEYANEMGFRMEKILSEELKEDDAFRFPYKLIDDEEYEGKENIEYCSACFSLRAKDL